MSESLRYDITILGGGIVGLATGLALRRIRPAASLLILEKEARLASHQTGHNSGVIHAGIYYRPGSEKARLCAEGVALLKDFCGQHGVAFENCGKLVVATEASELARLDELQRRAESNRVPGLRRVGAEEAREIEPHVRAVAALHSPETAIVDFAAVAAAMAAELEASGAEIRTGFRVERAFRDGPDWIVASAEDETRARSLINCCGLHCDRVAETLGTARPIRIVPFRGEYYELTRPELVRGLIYPVPDPEFPFLGVHFTRRIDGSVEAGPNAVLALAREGYRRGDLSAGDLRDMLSYGGFWRMAGRHWRMGLYESVRSWSKAMFVSALRRLLPEIQSADLCTGGSGVRAQALAPDGSLLDDFCIERSTDAVHVLNAPSPAATASLAIGRHIASAAVESVEALR